MVHVRGVHRVGVQRDRTRGRLGIVIKTQAASPCPQLLFDDAEVKHGDPRHGATINSDAPASGSQARTLGNGASHAIRIFSTYKNIISISKERHILGLGPDPIEERDVEHGATCQV